MAVDLVWGVSESRGRGLCRHPSVSPAAGPVAAHSCVRPVRPVSLRGMPLLPTPRGLDGHPVCSRCAVVVFGQVVRFVQRFHLTDMDYSPRTAKTYQSSP